MAVPRDVVDAVAREGLARPSARHTMARAATAAAAYAVILATALRADSLVVWVPAWAALGALLFGSWAAMHEAIHGHLFASRRANRLAGLAFGLTVLANFSAYRGFHLAHHAHTRVEGDPESHEDYRGPGDYLFFAPMIGGLFWLQLAAAAFTPNPPPYARTPRARTAIRVDAAAAVIALATALALTNPTTLLYAWAIPFAVSTIAVSIVTLPEHYGCEQVADPARATRTTLSNPVWRWLFWNNNFHTAHHVYPAVPYHRLPRLHELTADGHGHTAPSYTAFHVGLFRRLLDASRQ